MMSDPSKNMQVKQDLQSDSDTASNKISKMYLKIRRYISTIKNISDGFIPFQTLLLTMSSAMEKLVANQLTHQSSVPKPTQHASQAEEVFSRKKQLRATSYPKTRKPDH
ncbi:hypothetical protein XELAEV_18002931mg [Xenopus laevis]|nr:hypothetical protein XELAEV_18002931mg [Xenopus laevis]